MNRKAIILSAFLLTTTAQAQSAASAWETLGTYLKNACSMGNQVAGSSDKLQWLCNVSSSYAFLSTNVLNGDWQAFGQEVMGKYMNQAVEYMGQKMGFSGLNQMTADMNAAMQGTYNQFRAKLFDAMTLTLKQQQAMKDDNAGASVTTAGGLADYAVATNPFLTATQTAGRSQQTLDTFGNLLKAAQAKKVTEQSQKAVEAAMQPAMDSATSTIGTVSNQGFADKQVEKGKTALSQRELLQIQLETQAYALKQDASMRVNEFQLLVEIAKQGAMTNTQLISKLEDVSNSLTEQNNYVKQAMEAAAQENLQAGQAAVREYTQYIAQFKGVLDPAQVNQSANRALRSVK